MLSTFSQVISMTGTGKFFKEGLPMIQQFSTFYQKQVIISILKQVPFNKEEIDDEQTRQHLLDFFYHFMGLESYYIRKAAIERIMEMFELSFKPKQASVFLWKLYGDRSELRRGALTEFIKVLFKNEFLRNDKKFVNEFFSKLAEEPSDELKMQSMVCLAGLTKLSKNLLSQQFLKAIVDNLLNDRRPFVQMHVFTFIKQLEDKKQIEAYMKRVYKLRNIYVTAKLFDNLTLFSLIIP